MSEELKTIAAEVAYLRRDYEALRKSVTHLADRADRMLMSVGKEMEPSVRKLLHDLIDADR